MLSLLQKLNLMPKKCPYQGKRVKCPFVQDVRNPDKYVCLECGRQCSADGVKIGELFWWIVRIIILLSGLMD
jgi:hypothetical protein